MDKWMDGFMSTLDERKIGEEGAFELAIETSET